MKSALLLLTLLLFAASGTAQTQKKSPKPPQPPAFTPVLDHQAPPMQPSAIVKPVPAHPIRLEGETVDGQKVTYKSVEELQKATLQSLKSLQIHAGSDRGPLDEKMLAYILNTAPQLEELAVIQVAVNRFPQIATPHRSLKKLTLLRNGLKALPAGISNLVALEEFHSDNPLEALPASFSALRNLKTVLLHHNAFQNFPAEVFGLPQLRDLYVTGRFKQPLIKEVPDLFHQLPNLEELGIQYTSVTALPPSTATLKKLRKAVLSGNQLAGFPESLTVLPELFYVDLYNNPLQWEAFKATIQKIRWRGLFYIGETGLSEQQYKAVDKMLPKMDVYYE